MITLMLAAAVATSPPPSPTPPNPCNPAASCRYVTDVVVHDDKGLVSKTAVNAWAPFAQDGKLRLFPGELVTLRLAPTGELSVIAFARPEHAPIDQQTKQEVHDRARDDALLSAEPDNAMVPSQDEILVFFGQLDETQQSVLRVQNGYGKALSYKAYLADGRGGMKPTTVCPIRPKGGGIEGWNDAQRAILLTEFKLTDRGDERVILAECDNGAS